MRTGDIDLGGVGLRALGRGMVSITMCRLLLRGVPVAE